MQDGEEKYDLISVQQTSSSSSAQLEIEWWERADIVEDVRLWRLKHTASKLPLNETTKFPCCHQPHLGL